MKLVAGAVAVGAVLTFTLAGCGGDDNTNSTSSEITSGPSAPTGETPSGDRSALRAALAEQLGTTGDTSAANQTVIDCVIDGIDPSLEDEAAVRVATEGPDAENAAEVAFADLLLDCLG